MEEPTPRRNEGPFLVNITRHGRHAALLSTCDSNLVELLRTALAGAGYSMHVDSTPSPIGGKR